MESTRTCGDCSLCCKVQGVEALQKPQNTWCRHCMPGRGCTIYETRPGECREFSCLWLNDLGFGEEWRPSKCKFVLVSKDGGSALQLHCDPGAPGGWRREPFLSTLRKLAAEAMRAGRTIYAIDKGHAIVILPDRELDVGAFSENRRIVLSEIRSPKGVDYEVRVLMAPER